MPDVAQPDGGIMGPVVIDDDCRQNTKPSSPNELMGGRRRVYSCRGKKKETKDLMPTPTGGT